MAANYTTDEWEALIHKTATTLVVSENEYECPPIGTRDFGKTIDHTLLKVEATSVQIDGICEEAKEGEFASVCVRVNYVKQCVANLKETDVKVACVIGFHEGTYDLAYKLNETKEAISSGAHELDIVLNVPDLLAKNYPTIFTELNTLRAAAPAPTILKLILETSQLNRDQIIAGAVLAHLAGFDFIKTSTGFNGQGATEENVRLMKACCESTVLPDRRRMKVKASGGVRSLGDAVRMLKAGAERLGTSAGVAITREGKAAAAAGSGEAVSFKTEGVASGEEY
ncbi:Hypothetical protein R9X50_00456400 [Acrodontium crateriforme]|uniref:deoxyribose-phosphate aldolase n=1 Tax=Acrodontium crateriforme TaxID=150365 RepID=A0AAQ3MB69_9PEZI|nr:Hypothetical protein R9X50_00456400 [Acrodontium crateriforme]